MCYLDDFLVFGSTKLEADRYVERLGEVALNIRDVCRNTQVLLCLLRHFGFTPNMAKSKVVASQKREFLGMMVDSRRMELSIPEARLTRYRNNAKRMRGDTPHSWLCETWRFIPNLP